MASLRRRLDDILEERKLRASDLEAHEQRWTALRGSLEQLSGALDDLARHPNGPEGAAQLARRTGELPSKIDSDVETRLGRVRRRFMRSTINIGVAGRSRVGKSTLLQRLSGLNDDQIPTGESLEVTAVRSRIFHSTTASEAIITFHDWGSFRTLVLTPYCERLGWRPAPATPEELRSAVLPEISEGDPNSATLAKLRLKVEEMQRSLDSYLHLLTGDTRNVPLTQLRALVAFPEGEDQTKERRGGPPANRAYLAVREAVIYCAFPGVDVQRLGLIDLPGTGGINAAGEGRHVAGLKDEVDFIVNLCRPERYSHWGTEDAVTLDLVKESRCGADSQDFCHILINKGRATARQMDDFEEDARSSVGGGASRDYTIRRCDAISPESVRDDVLAPTLHHLAERLPGMDRAAMTYAMEGTGSTARQIQSVLLEVGNLLDSLPPAASSGLRVYQLAQELHQELGSDFYDLTEGMKEGARKGDTAEFEAEVHACEERCEAFLTDGLGRGRELWLNQVVKRLKTSKSTQSVAVKELNHVRIEFSRMFMGLDSLLQARIDRLQEQVVQLLAPRLALSGESSTDMLRQFRSLADEAGTSGFVAVIDELLDLSVSYRSHLHPQVREAMVLLEPESTERDGATKAERIEPVSFDEDGAEDLLIQINNIGTKVIGDCTRELFQRARLPDQAIYAAAEQFADGLLRAGPSEEDFHALALEHRDRIWPDEFASIDSQHRLHKRCRASMTAALAAADLLAEAPR